MIKQLVSVLDGKADVYSAPITIDTEPVFVRNLGDLIKSDPDHVWAQHPDDFVVYKVGEFDTVTGNITVQSPERMFGMSFITGLLQSVPGA